MPVLSAKRLSFRVYLTSLMFVASSMFAAPGFAKETKKTEPAINAVVYKTPTCGCCTAWEEHLKSNGFKVESKVQEDLTKIKQENGVTPQLGSCHTALIGGYVVEGHVPAVAIKKMLKEKPKFKGIAAPGMPQGSPGMEGPVKEKFDVVSFDEKGNKSVYMSF